MGTVVTFDVFHLNDDHSGELSEMFDAAICDLHDVDAMLSTWILESPLNQFRRGEIARADIPREIEEVLEACVYAREVSWGWFDPWALAGGFDPTGYVKGWAAQRARQFLRAPWLMGAIVNAGGDISVAGSPAPGERFRVGIVNPFETKQLAFVVNVDAAVATSGGYERSDQLINPATGVAHSAVASATVAGPELGLADALATALAVGGVQVLSAIDELSGYEAFTIGHDAVVSATREFPFAK